MRPKFIDIVQCIHEGNKKPFIFLVDEDVQLDIGDYVLVKTSLGPNRMARCITPSFHIGDWQLKEFYGIELDDLKPVTHILKPVPIGIKRSGE